MLTNAETDNNRELKVTILLHEHSMIRNEVLTTMGHYKNHTRVLQIVTTGVLALLYWYITQPDKTRLSFNSDFLAWQIGFGIVFLHPWVCGYLIFDIIHDMYGLILLGTRLQTIERQVAKLVDSNLLMWEKVAQRFYSEPLPSGVWNPVYFHSVIAAIVVVALMGVLPLKLYSILWNSPMRVHAQFAGAWFALGLVLCSIIVVASFAYYWHVLMRMRSLVFKWLDRELTKCERKSIDIVGPKGEISKMEISY